MSDTTRPLVSEAGHARQPAPTGQKSFDVPSASSAGGMAMPKLGLGTWQLDDDAARQAVIDALQIGYRHIDTAQMYGNETGVGRGIADAGVPRDQLFLTTKVDNDNHEPDRLVASVEESLTRLDTDHVDLLLVHWPVDWDRIGATLAALAQVQAAGLARHLGVSNFTIEQLETARDLAPIEVLQAECHPFFRQDELRRWCRENGWVFTAYSPLAQGDVMDSDALDEIADAHDVSPAAAAIAWLTSLDGVVAIPRSADRDHIEANWQAQFVALSDDETDRIEQLADGRRLVDPDFAPW